MIDHARMQRTKRPHKSAVWKKRGQDYLKRGRYEDALHAFEQSLLHYPDADDYIYKGMIFAQLGRSEEAFATFEHAIELDPNFALAYARLAAVYSNLGESDRAIDYSKKSFDLRDSFTPSEQRSDY